ncbi:MAG TPA: ABC transporter ATP-binding protein [Anaerolineae bacterium]|nr:ABC transporter ATP-binding protein [Anaerolineae bacterium]
MAFLEIENLEVEYEKGSPVLWDFSLSVEEGELISLLGPSGCGKTTTLRTVAGFITPRRGHIRIAGKDYTRQPPNKRNIGLVFQSYALFPHLTVFDNVAFGLKMRRVSRVEIKQRVTQVLDMVEMAGFEDRLPSQLSGGQQQRVALARAVVVKPDLLLLDEPLSNLDAKLRIGMRAELHRLQRQLGITMIYVTHDQVEALSLSDRVVVMNQGQIEQIGTPEEIYFRPATLFVAQFVGFDNGFTARVVRVADDRLELEADGIRLFAEAHGQSRMQVGDQVNVSFRPEAVLLHAKPGPNRIPGEVIFRTFQGSTAQYLIRTKLGDFTATVYEVHPSFVPGPVYLAVAPENLIVRPTS